MKIIGFNFTKNDFRYAILEGEIENPIYRLKDKIVIPKSMETPELMEWLETQLNLIIDKNKPDKVGYKIYLPYQGSLNVSQITKTYYAQAILNLSCSKKRIAITSFPSQAINGTKLGLPRKADLPKHVDNILGQHPPHWDKPTKEAVIVAWFLL